MSSQFGARLGLAAPAASTARGILQRKCGCGTHAPGGGDCRECSKKKQALQRKSGSRGEAEEVPAQVYEVLGSPGAPLDMQTRGFMEARLGHDFSGVRVHTDARAAQSARAVNAAAYTVGQNLVFDSGQYAPASNAGRRLIAHELTHVLQQSSGAASASGAGLGIGPADDSLERQADAVAGSVTAPAVAAPRRVALSAASPSVQRQPAAGSCSAGLTCSGEAVVEDDGVIAPGQMHKSEFLAALREQLIQGCDAELKPYNRTARGCPYIMRSIEHYSARPVSSLLRVIRGFAHPGAGATAQGLIGAVVEKARRVSRGVAQKAAPKQAPKAQAKAERDAPAFVAPDASAVQRQLGGGRLLDSPVRQRMEQAFQASFESVRIHTDGAASRLNSELGARALTVGSNVAFAAGQYQPGTRSGDMLIAHELAHTLQQGSDRTGQADRGNGADLEHQADRAATAAVNGEPGAASLARPDSAAVQIQRWPAVLAGALVVAEAAPEAVVIGEIGAVSTEVVVADGVVVAAAEAAPAVVVEAAPAVLPAAIPAAAPAAVSATSTAAVTSSTLSTAAAVTATGVAATTLSSDSSSPTEQKSDPQKTCQEQHPEYGACLSAETKEMVAARFALGQGITATSVDCSGISSFGPGMMYDCGGAPGENYHCTINKSELVVSLIGCYCCGLDGEVGYNWSAHQSPGAEEGDRGRRRQDTRQDRRRNQDRDRQKRDRRDRGGDN